MTNKNLTIGLVVVAVIAIIGLFTPAGKVLLGGVTNYDELDATAIKIGGTNGSRVGPIIAGSANFLGMDVSQAASTTASYDLAITGIVAGDTVFATLGTTTQNTSVLNWAIQGCVASTTSGFATCRVTNFSGIAATPSVTAVGSSTHYLVLHPRSTVPGL